MSSISGREEIVEAFDALAAAVGRVTALDFDVLTTPERLALLERCEVVRRQLPVIEHPLIDEVRRQASPIEVGGRLADGLADRCRITRADAKRRIADAYQLVPRRALSGEPLPALLPATAAAQRAGHIGEAHVGVIRAFLRHLPRRVDAPTRAKAEADLARHGGQFRPEQLARIAERIADRLNPDGTFTDEDRARSRGIILGRQRTDGMSKLTGYLTPEARATLEAVWAKLAAPGACNPEHPDPVLDDTPPRDAVDSDHRSTAQRHHDGLNAGLRALLASGNLGQHNGLPATIIVTTTLAELESAAGRALTGGGTLLPMRDVIALASHAHHYLAIFDNGKTIGLYHTKRLASPAQRIVLYARDRGCTAPNCDVPGYHCQAHHVNDYATTRRTHIDELALACGGHHPLVQPGGWTTRTRANGDIEWLPPPHLDHGQPRTNTYHHPEKLLHDDDDDDEDSDAA